MEESIGDFQFFCAVLIATEFLRTIDSGYAVAVFRLLTKRTKELIKQKKTSLDREKLLSAPSL